MQEIWQPVPIEHLKDFYAVSNMGRFKSLKWRHGGGVPKVLKMKLMKDGYLYARMNGKNGQEFHNAHRLVATTFIANPDNKPQVNHINSIRNDNRVENLEWVTPKENIVHAIKFGHFMNGVLLRTSRRRKSTLQATCHPAKKSVGYDNLCKSCYMREWKRKEKLEPSRKKRKYTFKQCGIIGVVQKDWG